MTNTIKLEMAIVRAKTTKCLIAQKLGISAMGLYKKINNVTEFKASEIAILQDYLQLSKSERDEIFFAHNVD